MFATSLSVGKHVCNLLVCRQACLQPPCLLASIFATSLSVGKHHCNLLVCRQASLQPPCLYASMLATSLSVGEHVCNLPVCTQACLQPPCLYASMFATSLSVRKYVCNQPPWLPAHWWPRRFSEQRGLEYGLNWLETKMLSICRDIRTELFSHAQSQVKKFVSLQTHLSEHDYPGSNSGLLLHRESSSSRMRIISISYIYDIQMIWWISIHIISHLCRPVRSTFAVRETASLGIMGEPRVPPLNPSESIVLWEHYRLWGV